MIEGGKALIQPAVEKVTSVGQYGMDKVNAGKEYVSELFLWIFNNEKAHNKYRKT